MLSFAEARERVLDAARPLGAERVALERADGRVLAEDVLAPDDQPSCDRSAMDGYAVRAADLAGAPTALRVVGESAAGGSPDPLDPGTAMRIFTGAAMPVGADAVVMQEDVEREGGLARFSTPPARGAHVRPRGQDLSRGAVALRAGTRLGPGQVALAAACDRSTLLVGRRPVVAILASGDELRAPGDAARPGSIPESNTSFVAAAARRAGARARILPFVPDELDASTRAFQSALDGADLVCSIGGVSVGDRDVMRPAMEAAGISLTFFRVAIKPGKPLVLGRGPRGQVALGLPGNPASASLTFLLFAVPLLRAMQGDLSPLPPLEPMPLAAPLARRPGRTEFARAVLERDDAGRTSARLLDNQASGAVTAFARADALVVLDADRARVEAGELIPVLRLGSGGPW